VQTAQSADSGNQVQIELRGGYGEIEVVWATPRGDRTYEILNTPVYAYNISTGTVVQAERRPNGRRCVVEVVEPSRGVTVRILTPEGERASEIYRSVVVPGCKDEGLCLGPATMLDPRIAAFYVDDRERNMKRIVRFFGDLERKGVLRWELADPDPTPPGEQEHDQSRSAVVLIHPR
jgi:hypothetical protein